MIQNFRARSSFFLARLTALLLGASFLCQTEITPAQVSGAGRGVAGGVLLGAEVTVFGEAIAGLETPWFYWAGAGAGAVGGGIGGYYIESNGSARTSYLLLTGGMALTIPAMIVYLDATRNAARHREPGELGPNFDEEPLDDYEQEDLSSMHGIRLHAPGAFDRSAEGWTLGLPSARWSPVYSPVETAEFRVPQRTQVLFQLLSGVF